MKIDSAQRPMTVLVDNNLLSVVVFNNSIPLQPFIHSWNLCKFR